MLSRDASDALANAEVTSEDAISESECDNCSVDPLAACLDYAQTYCSRLQTCSPSALLLDFGTQQTCQERMAANCPNEFVAPGAAVTPIGLANCARARARQTCTEFLTDRPLECYWQGALSDGAPCEYDSQCQSSACYRTNGWCGTCQPRVGLGASCDPTQVKCASGLLCADANCSGGVCQPSSQWTCTRPVPASGSCVSPNQCVGTVICLHGTCTTGKQLGESCQALDECDLYKGLYCSSNASGSAYTCTQIKYASTGQACDYLSGVLCVANGTCRGADGGPNDIGTCSAAAVDGQPCDPVTRCLAPVLCVGGTCWSPVPPSSCR
jgi:hypothetical protein